MRRILEGDVYQKAALKRGNVVFILRPFPLAMDTSYAQFLHSALTFSSRSFIKLNKVVPLYSAALFSRRRCFGAILHTVILTAYVWVLCSARS